MPQKHHIINLDPFVGHVPGTPLPAHPEPTVSVANQDTMTWECHKDFVILNIHPDLPVDPTKPSTPFHRPLPYDARKGKDGPGDRFRANSGAAVSAAKGQRYKVVFQIKGDPAPIDPHFIVDD